MSPNKTPGEEGAPEDVISNEITGSMRENARVQMVAVLAKLEARFDAFEKNIERRLGNEVPSMDRLRAEVTGARQAVMAASASQVDVNALRTDLLTFKKEYDENKPPSFWKIVAWLAGAGAMLILTIGGIIWSASARVSDISTRVEVVSQANLSLNTLVNDLLGRIHTLESKSK